MESLDRIAKHLPMVGPNGILGRFSLESGTWKWITDDLTLIVLKGRLLVEAELVEICRRCLKKPDALGDLTFAQRQKFLHAVLGDDEVPEAIWSALQDLNKIRNEMAHHLEPKGAEASIDRFIQRFAEWKVPDLGEETPKRLLGYLAFLIGSLSSIGKHESEVDE